MDPKDTSPSPTPDGPTEPRGRARRWLHAHAGAAFAAGLSVAGLALAWQGAQSCSSMAVPLAWAAQAAPSHFKVVPE